MQPTYGHLITVDPSEVWGSEASKDFTVMRFLYKLPIPGQDFNLQSTRCTSTFIFCPPSVSCSLSESRTWESNSAWSQKENVGFTLNLKSKQKTHEQHTEVHKQTVCTAPYMKHDLSLNIK